MIKNTPYLFGKALILLVLFLITAGCGVSQGRKTYPITEHGVEVHDNPPPPPGPNNFNDYNERPNDPAPIVFNNGPMGLNPNLAAGNPLNNPALNGVNANPGLGNPINNPLVNAAVGQPAVNNVGWGQEVVHGQVLNEGFAPDGRHRLEIKMDAGDIVNAEQYIVAVNPNNGMIFGQVDIDVKRRILQKLTANGLIDRFFLMDPSYDQVWRFIRQNGGFMLDEELDLVFMVKNGIKYRDWTGQQYAEIMGQVFANGFNDPEYLQRNSTSIFDTIEYFAGIRPAGTQPCFKKSFKDLEVLKTFITTIGMPPQVGDDQRNAVKDLIDAHIVAKKAHHHARVLPDFRAKILAKYQAAAPNLAGDIKYFHLRDPNTWGINTLATANFECSICLDDIDGIDPHQHHTHKGYKCPFDNNQNISVCPDCIKGRIVTSHEDGLLTCPRHGHTHELPVTRAVIENALNNDAARIFKWEKALLRRYAEALGIEYVHCGHPQCENLILKDDVGADGHAVCQACESKFCFSCQKNDIFRAHVGLACGVQMRPDYVGPENIDVRPCPYCLRPINRVGGCNAIMCLHLDCRAQFNWVYGKYRKGTTTNERHWEGVQANDVLNRITPERTYRIPGDIDYSPDKEGTSPEKPNPNDNRFMTLIEAQNTD